jgi:periplasmic divalent cation tolerance protein
LNKNIKLAGSRMANTFIAILCTCPNHDTATALASKLIKTKLAACVSIIPGIESVYIWEDKIEINKEFQLIIKTIKAAYEKVEELIKKHHPYTCPEIIAIPIECGSQEYLNWVKQVVIQDT